MTNLEAVAHEYAKGREAAYVLKRGGSVPADAAFSVYMAAFNSFIRKPR